MSARSYGSVRRFLVIYGQAVVKQFLDTFTEFPPRQRAASFTIDQAVEQLNEFARDDDPSIAWASAFCRQIEDAPRHLRHLPAKCFGVHLGDKRV